MPKTHRLLALKRIFAELIGAWTRGQYHPERHYMRGPGPATLSKTMPHNTHPRHGGRHPEQA
ncbi:hypothetical protein [Aminobacter aminovorans]|uniref:hypothetical protein n=1 Tax=Aminobacter aminovorans TaxID=83263 RepID=UPI000E1FF031|nr:hypothetical protein [Aminobacter aminovorans]